MLLFACDSGPATLAPAEHPDVAARGARRPLDPVEQGTPPALRRFRRGEHPPVGQGGAEPLPESAALTISAPTDLGRFFPEATSVGWRINAGGQVAGYTIDLADGPQVIHAYRWETDGSPILLAARAPGAQELAHGLNDAGVVVGFETNVPDPTLGFRMQAVRWDPTGVRSELPRLPGAGDQVAEAINNAGVIVGWALDPLTSAATPVRWEGSLVVPLPGHGAPRDLNQGGTAVGFVEQPGLRPAKWSPDGQLTVLPLPSGTAFGFADGINDLGVVVGTAGTSDGSENSFVAVMWAPDGTPTVLPSPGNAQAFAIDNLGVVAGVLTPPGVGFGQTSPGVLWYQGSTIPVPPLAPEFAGVRDLSETQLTGEASFETDPDRVSRAARWSLSLRRFEFSGFDRPVRDPGAAPPFVLNQVAAGRTVPVRFGLGGDHGLDVLAPGSPSSKPVACTVAPPGGGVAATSVGGTGLSYLPGAGRYRYLWKTERAWAGTCRQFDLTLTDGSTHSALFRFAP